MLCLSGAICSYSASGAEWLTLRGDGQQTGWQPNEQHLSPKTVKGMRLLWKRQLGAEVLSAPILLGPIITHRGIKELVLVARASGKVSALDADLGSIFWTRDLPVSAAHKHCRAEQPMAPMVLSSTVAAFRAADSTTDDEFSDGNRPVLVAGTDGVIHSLRLSSGEDLSPPRKLTEWRPVMLAGFGDALYGGGSEGCDQIPRRLDSIRMNRPGEPGSTAVPNDEGIGGIALGVHGTVYLNVGGAKDRSADVAFALAEERLQVEDALPRTPADTGKTGRFAGSNILVFQWRGREVAVMVNAGQLVVWNRKTAGSAASESTVFNGQSGDGPTGEWSALGGLTAWEDPAGERWICALGKEALSQSIHAFRVVDIGGHVALELAWRSKTFPAASAPVVAAGVLYFVEVGTRINLGGLKLVALETKTGALLASVSDGLERGRLAGGLSLANGHICFTTIEGILYCFGLPIEI